MTAPIIMLVGVSSAGKSSLAKALQVILAEPYLHFNVDHLMEMVPVWCVEEEPCEVPPEHGGFWWRTDEQSTQFTQVGAYGRHVIHGIHRAVGALADFGLNLIVEDVLYEPEWLDDYVEVLKSHRVLLVEVVCPLSELERRERERGDRTEGQARGDLQIIHRARSYDLVVDTSERTAKECAHLVKRRLEEDRPFEAFVRLGPSCRSGGAMESGDEVGS